MLKLSSAARTPSETDVSVCFDLYCSSGPGQWIFVHGWHESLPPGCHYLMSAVRSDSCDRQTEEWTGSQPQYTILVKLEQTDCSSHAVNMFTPRAAVSWLTLNWIHLVREKIWPAACLLWSIVLGGKVKNVHKNNVPPTLLKPNNSLSSCWFRIKWRLSFLPLKHLFIYDLHVSKQQNFCFSYYCNM